MLATFKNYIAAEKARREENDEKGFSLIELIVVVVILGILVAIAIPVFLNIQQQARDNAVSAVAANGATQAASAMAQDTDAAAVDLSNLVTGDVASVVLTTPAAGTDIEQICVTATLTSGESDATGPGCP
jgi:type IV pilus assembly protein PilA